MAKIKSKYYKLIVAATLVAISVVLQVFHPLSGITTQWGMWIDIVAVTWVIAFFLFDIELALSVSVVMLFVMSLVAPSGFIGAIMKWIATVPMFIVPSIFLFKVGKQKKTQLAFTMFVGIFAVLFLIFLVLLSLDVFAKADLSAGSNTLPVAIIVLSTIVFYLGIYYFSKKLKRKSLDTFADPKTILVALILAIVVRGITASIANYYFAIPLFFGMTSEQALAFVPWYVMFGLNAIQGVIDLMVAWVLVFKTGLREKFGT